jgi:hypothetical protein
MFSKPAADDTKKGPAALELLPIALVMVVFFAAIPWLKLLSDGLVMLITAAVSIFVMGYANYFAFRHQRGLDEVQRASAGFAAQWGVPAGQAAFVLLLLLPPFQGFATSVINEFAGDPGIPIGRTAVILTMAFGFCGVVLLQAIGTLVINLIWWKSRQ